MIVILNLPAVARLLGRTDDNDAFQMSTPSDFCAACKLVEQTTLPCAALPGEVEAVGRELHEARASFPAGHYEVNKMLVRAIAHLKRLDGAYVET